MLNRLLIKISILFLIIFLSACSHHGAHKPQIHKKRGIFSSAPSEEDQIADAVAGDGPPESEIDVTHIPNAVPRIEPLSRYGNPNKYEVFGKHYYTLPHSDGYSAEGMASWYGKKFHGQRTSSGEKFDMYGMTAAHRSLPLPTYAKIENLKNGKEIIVKINDRGPFVKNRLIDLSYAAAKKLGIHSSGTGKVRITAIDPVAWHKQQKGHTLAKADAKSSKAKASKSAKGAKDTKASTTTLAQVDKAKTSSTAKSPKTAKATTTAKAADKKQIYVQLGAFSKKNNAQKLADKATTLTTALNTNVHVHEGKSSDKGSFKVRIGPLKNEQEAQKLQKKLVALNGATPKVIYE